MKVFSTFEKFIAETHKTKMQIEYLSTLKSKVKSLIDENSIPFKKIGSEGEKVVSAVKDETSSVEIALVSFYKR